MTKTRGKCCLKLRMSTVKIKKTRFNTKTKIMKFNKNLESKVVQEGAFNHESSIFMTFKHGKLYPFFTRNFYFNNRFLHEFYTYDLRHNSSNIKWQSLGSLFSFNFLVIVTGTFCGVTGIFSNSPNSKSATHGASPLGGTAKARLGGL